MILDSLLLSLSISVSTVCTQYMTHLRYKNNRCIFTSSKSSCSYTSYSCLMATIWNKSPFIYIYISVNYSLTLTIIQQISNVSGYSEHSPTVQKVQVFEKYFVSWQKLYNLVNIKIMSSSITSHKMPVHVNKVTKKGDEKRDCYCLVREEDVPLVEFLYLV